MVNKTKVYGTYEKGKFYEYLFLNKLKENKCFCIRSPASGRRSRRFVLPDVVGCKNGKIFLFEVKYRSDSRDILILKSQYRKYRYIEKLSGGTFFICTYYRKIKEFRCLLLQDYDYETNRFFVFKMKSFKEKGKTVEEVVSF